MIQDHHVFLLLLIINAFWSCQSERVAEIERPVEEWVKRSVLDQQPRMLTLALHEDMYVAYRTETSLPYKIWQGGVYWDGAAYNNIKTIQPQSWGNTYWEEKLDRLVWKIKSGDSTYVVHPQFKGYLLQNKQITASPGPFWLDRCGCNTCHEMEKRTIGPSYPEIAARYPQNPENVELLRGKVKKGGFGNWGDDAKTGTHSIN